MMSDHGYDPPESMRTKPSRWVDATLISFFSALVVAPPLLAWWNGNLAWLFGWVLLLILGLAG